MGNSCCGGSRSSEPAFSPDKEGDGEPTNFPTDNKIYKRDRYSSAPGVPEEPKVIVETLATKSAPSFPLPPVPPQKTLIALYNFEARDSQDVSFIKGDRMELEGDFEGEWLYVEHMITGKRGYVPRNFVAEELSIESEDWFFGNISRKEAEKMLLGDKNEPIGTFIIRPSEHNPAGYSLSIKTWENDRGIHAKHYKIKPFENGGFYISQNKIFSSLSELVDAYRENNYGICHLLTKPCHKPKPTMYDLTARYKDKWEIPRHEIELLRRLGKGNFGEVYYGKWKNYYEVAVKTIRHSGTSTMTKEAFLQEAGIMKKFRHKSLVQLYGVCTLSEPIYIIQEYMEKGSLLEFLQQDGGKTIRFEDQIFIAYQVASGMAHLESLNFIHRDLAARNVLLGENNVAKICDFGLARIMDNQIYASQGGRFPVKWTAPESLSKSIFTIKSDVWSFGIFLTELFTFGAPPYEGMPSSLVFELVGTGYRMKKPDNLPDEIYDLMQRCWHEKPERRPSFKYLKKYFESIEVIYGGNDQNSSVVLSRNTPKSYDDHLINMDKF